MVSRYAECSTVPYGARLLRNISALITIHFTGSIAGALIYDYWMSRRLKQSLMSPLSHPFVERLIGTVRREYLDKTLFWNERDLDRKLLDFKDFYNRHRTHEALDGVTPAIRAELTENKIIDLNSYHWKSHCHGLYQTPMAA